MATSSSESEGVLLKDLGSVWCVGRNYAEHIKELGNDSSPASYPMIFLKAGSTVIQSGVPLPLPAWSNNIHHEIELALQLGSDLTPVRGAVALDMTLRDIQDQLKKKSHPWDLAKGYKASAPIGNFFDIPSDMNLHDLEIHLMVNGKTRQLGNTRDMLFKVDALLQYIKDRFPVRPGDLVLTGTPHGVSEIKHGDDIVARIVQKGQVDLVLSEGVWKAVKEDQI